MRAYSLRSLLSLVLLLPSLSGGGELEAQKLAAASCQESWVARINVDSLPSPWDRVHPSSLEEAVRGKREMGNWPGALEVIMRSFNEVTEATLGQDSSAVQKALRMNHQWVRLIQEIRGDDESGRRTAALGGMGRFEPAYISGTVTFFPRDTLSRFTLNGADGQDRLRAFCWHALATHDLLTEYQAPATDISRSTLASAVRSWDTFNEKSYSQYPWELLLNRGWAFSDDLLPPRFQLILAHPSIAVEAIGSGVESLRRNDVLALEPLGFLVYSDSRSFYLGVSALTTLSTDQKPGAGFLIHLGSALRAGYVWREGATGEGARNGPVFSVDLYDFLSGVPEKYEAARIRASTILEKARGGF